MPLLGLLPGRAVGAGVAHPQCVPAAAASVARRTARAASRHPRHVQQQQPGPAAAAAAARQHRHWQQRSPVAAAAAAAAAPGGGGGGGGVDLSALGLAAPDIDAADIASYQQELGAEFDASGVAQTFNNTSKVLEALADGVALVERSHWGRLRVAGRDRLDLLHNQSTAAFKDLAPGQGCDTVFVTATARCLDLATALVLDSSVMLLVSPSMRQPLLQRLQGVIFPADDVTVTDVSDRCRMLTLLGPQADDVLRELAGDAFTLSGRPYGSHQLLAFGARAPVVLAVGGGLAVPGYTLIVDERGAADLYAALVNKGCVPMGEQDWERLRITQGRPAAGAELTDAYNPLEAGLSHAVSLGKGCYIGQETLAKVTNTNGVKQQLWGLQLSGRAAPGAAVTSLKEEEGGSSSSGGGGGSGGELLGRLTSVANLEGSGHFGLAYLKCRRGGAQVPLGGLTVAVDGLPAKVVAKVVDVPYATRELPRTGGSDGGGGADGASEAGSLQDRAAAARAAKEADKAAEAAAKAARLEAMQARLAAWQQQQQQQGQQQKQGEQ